MPIIICPNRIFQNYSEILARLKDQMSVFLEELSITVNGFKIVIGYRKNPGKKNHSYCTMNNIELFW